MENKNEHHLQLIIDNFPYLSDQDIQQLRTIISTREPVLINGESGTGKSYLAQLIHRASGRSGACRSISLADSLFEKELFSHAKEGAFADAACNWESILEQCQGGTIILEDMADLDVEKQKKLLALLDSKKVRKIGTARRQSIDVRIIITNCSLTRKINGDSICENPYFRLTTGFEITLPRLGMIDAHFLEKILRNEILRWRSKYSLHHDDGKRIELSRSLINSISKCLVGNYRELQRLALFFAFQGGNAFSRSHLPFRLPGKR